jgi:hypothetical protein
VGVRYEGISVVSNPLDWAAQYRNRAVECTQLVETSFDGTTALQYRLLAERYIKLAECEEEFAVRHIGQAHRARA